ncbi:ABC transporter substrate-binding protein [Mycobacterium sp. NPDC003449]
MASALISGCSSAQQSDGSSTGSEARKPTDQTAAELLPEGRSGKPVVFATDATYRPFETVDPATKEVVGLDADLVAAIGTALGLEVKLTNVGFDSIVPGLQARKYDAAASGISVTPEREQVVEFVPYMRAGSGLAVQKGNPRGLRMEPLALCGHVIGAPKGTIQAVGQLPAISSQCVSAGKPEVSVSQFPSQEAVNLALSSGRIDAAMAATIGLAIQVEGSNGALELAPGTDYDPQPVALAFPKGSDLVPAVKAAMGQLASSGDLEQIVTKWGMPSESVYTGAP